MRLISIAILTSALMVASPALAAGKKCDEAKQIFDSGKRQYDLGRYNEAIQIWQELYVDCPSAALLFNMAQAHRIVGNHEAAITLYRSWLRESPKADPSVRKEVEDRIADLAQQIAAKREVAESPPTGVATSDGQLETRPSDEKSAAEPTEPAHQEPPPRDTPRWYEDKLGWTVAAIGIVGVGIGTGFLVSASSAESDADSAMSEQSYVEAIDRADSHGTIGTVTLIGGAAVLTAGVVLLVWHPSSSEATDSTATRVSVGPGWVGIVGSF